MKKLVVISGVTGMTGNEVARQLLKKGYSVVGFDNFFASSIDSISDILDNPKFNFFEYDLNSSDEMAKLKSLILNDFGGYDLDFINCAAVVHTKHFYEIDDTFETNVEAMKSFLDMAIELNADSYINCSTSEVYSMESYRDGGVKESDPILMATAEQSQRTSYATGKLLTEFFMKDAVDKTKIKGCSIRFANVYSNDELYPEHIIPFIVSTFQKSNKITLLENSKVNKRTFLHNYDSCSAVIALMEHKEALDGTVYNVGTTEEISIVDLVHKIADKMGIQDVEITFKGYRDADPERRMLNIDKISQRTNWQPTVDLDTGLDMTLKTKLDNHE